MDIGKERDKQIIEPIKNPVPQKDEPAKDPATPRKEPVKAYVHTSTSGR